MWKTDRSRFITGLADCNFKRYANYHAFGYGFTKQAQSMPLAGGIYVHECLALILIHCQLTLSLGQVVDSRTEQFKGVVRGIINKQIASYKALVAARGYLDVEGQDEVQFLINEQSALIEGLVWGWVRSQLDTILRDFEIISVENEEELVVGCSCDKAGFPADEHREECRGIVQMSRPDIILRRKADGKLGNHDFKTAAYVNDSYINEFRSSVQMAVGSLGAEARLGEPVDHYYIHALHKGIRKSEYDSDVRDYRGPRRQHSVFCYLYVREGNPPLQERDFQPQWKWTDDQGKGHTLGRAYQKTPIWLVDFRDSGKPEHVSNVEWWVYAMPEGILHEQFLLIGPYERQEVQIPEYLQEMWHEEWRWVERLTILAKVQEEYGWESTIFQGELRAQIARSWQCHKYKTPCPYIPICFKHPGWENPFQLGYVPRRPHHAGEIVEMESRGIPVPALEGEEEIEE